MRASWPVLRRTLLTTIAVAATAVLPGRAIGAVGDLDPTFGTGGKVTSPAPQPFFGSPGLFSALALQTDGKLVVAGNSGGDFGIARFLANALVLQSDGRLIAAGLANWGPGLLRKFGVARYNANGTPDASFGSAGLVVTDFGTDAFATGLVLQPDGRLVAGGLYNSGYALARYLPAAANCPVETRAATSERPPLRRAAQRRHRGKRRR